MSKRWVLLICLLWLGTVQAASGWSTKLGQLQFHPLGTAEGLGNIVVQDAIEDSHGFLWVATQGGLFRWDGYQFHQYSLRPGAADSVPDNFITVLCKDDLGRLWLGTASNGVARYDALHDRFISYTTRDHGLSKGAINALATDHHGGLWIGTDTGLDHLSLVPGSEQVQLRHYRQEQGLPSNIIRAIYQESAGPLWVGTMAGLARRDTDSQQFSLVRLRGSQPGPISITKLMHDSRGVLWVGSNGNGLFTVQPGTSTTDYFNDTAEAKSLFKRQEINGIAEAADGRIWVSTSADDLVVIARDSNTIERYPHEDQAAPNSAAAVARVLFLDRSGLLWLATDYGLSLYQANPGTLSLTVGKHQPGRLNHGELTALASDSHGRIWTATQRHGVDQIDPASGHITAWHPRNASGADFFDQHNANTLMVDQDDVLWVASSYGLYRSTDGGRSAQRMQAAWLDPQWYVRVLLRQQQWLWIGTATDGLFQARLGPGLQLEKVRQIVGLSGNEVQALYPDHNGLLWVGTSTGLNLLDPDSGRVLETIEGGPEEHQLSNASINVLQRDPQGRLWIGSDGGIDIMLADGPDGKHRFQRLGLVQGLPDLAISTLLPDRQGHFWSSTDTGIAMIDTRTLAIQTLRQPDGVLHAPYWMRSGLVHASGDLLFGGSSGLTVLRPQLYRAWSYTPPVVISSLRVGQTRLPIGPYNAAQPARVTIEPDANSITCEFAALDFTAPQMNRYAYRLEGFDQQWTYADASHRVANYTNLAPGQYRLQIRGSNRNGIWNSQQRELLIVVLPAWYQTWWAYLCLLLLLFSSLYSMARWRTRQLAARAAMLEQQIAERTAEVQQERDRAAQQHQQVCERNTELSTINTVAQLTVGKLDSTDLIHQVGAHLESMLGPQLTIIAVPAAEAELSYLYCGGQLGQATQRAADLAQQVIASSSAQNWHTDAGAGLCVPMIAQGVVMGAILIQRAPPQPPYQASEQSVLGTIAAYLAAALQNAQLYQQTEIARHRAEAATEAKSMFLANMSHEIRTPMHAIIGLSHLALNSEVPARQRDYLQKIERAGQSLMGIINDILDFSKIEAGKLELHNVDFELDDLLDPLRAVSSTYNPNQIACYFELGAGLPRRLHGDQQRLEQILLNLLSNALKFTFHGSVTLSIALLEREQQRLQLAFSVRDSGIGMNAAQIDLLCQPFTQLDDSSTRKFSGTGLGLSICQALVQLMEGTLHIGSQPGVGSCFTVQLWLTEAQSVAAPQAQAHAPQYAGQYILLVEDHPVNQEIALGLLQACGLRVDLANTGQQALNLLAQHPQRYQLVLMDLQMPELDGLSATRILRAQPNFTHLPIVALSANAEAEQRQHCLQQGFNDYLSKPLLPAQLHQLLQRYLGTGEPTSAPLPAAHLSHYASLAGFDLERAWRNVNGDPVLLHKVLLLFQQDSSSYHARLTQAWQQADWAGLRCAAHALRAAASSLGARQLVPLASTLEGLAAREQQISTDYALPLQQLELVLQELQRQLRACLPATSAVSTAVADIAALRQLVTLIRQQDSASWPLWQQQLPVWHACFGPWDTDAITHCLQRLDFRGAEVALRWLAHKHHLTI